MAFETRNAYGFPVDILPEPLRPIFDGSLFAPAKPEPAPESKFEKARRYAAEAKARNQSCNTCEACKQAELLQTVIQITNNWSPK